jgi:hypothetical protein
MIDFPQNIGLSASRITKNGSARATHSERLDTPVKE